MEAHQPLSLLESALDVIGERVDLAEREQADTHLPIEASGLDEPEVAHAIGRYAVGAIAGAVDLDASLQSVLLVGGVDRREEIESEVETLVGSNNTFESEAGRAFRDRWRNPWIAEVTTHALLVVRARRETACLPGAVGAVSQPHPRPTRQGLDSVAIYSQEGEPFIAIGETKASRVDGSGQLTVACDLYDQVDDGKFGNDLRQHLMSLRRVLDPGLAPQVSESLWRHSRCYVPAIFHETPFDPDAPRERLGALVPPIDRRRVLILRFAAFHAFFNNVSDAMRASVAEVII